jgi:hypothetical protein
VNTTKDLLDGIPARLVLPMIGATGHDEVLFAPDDLAANLKLLSE